MPANEAKYLLEQIRATLVSDAGTPEQRIIFALVQIANGLNNVSDEREAGILRRMELMGDAGPVENDGDKLFM